MREEFFMNGNYFYEGQTFSRVEEFYAKVFHYGIAPLSEFKDENVVRIYNSKIVKPNELCLVWLEECKGQYVLHITIEDQAKYASRILHAWGLPSNTSVFFG